MTEERSIRLLDALEGRTDTLLERLRQERESRLALQQRLAELEAARLALAEKARELEANRLELVEENRELDEQNRELEEHNRHLHERLAKGPGENTFPRPARRSQGLSALMGRSSSETSAGSSAGARFIGGPTPRRAAEAPSPDTPSPDRPGADNTVGDASEAPSPQALLAEWYRRYPAAFFKGHTRPLKVGIHEELAAREPWPEKLVRRALACYVNLPRYLKAVREGAERIDLAGQPAGVVDAQAAEHARKKLERLQADRQQRRGKGAGPGRAAKPRAAGRKPAVPAADRAPAAKPVQAEAPAAPATLEEKLSALLAKHNGR